MDASSRGLASPLSYKLRRFCALPLAHHRLDFRTCGRDRSSGRPVNGVRCSCSEMEFRKLAAGERGKNVEKKVEEWPFEPKKMAQRRSRVRAMPLLPFSSPRARGANKQVEFFPRCTPRSSGPQSRDTPPKRGQALLSMKLQINTGIASEKDWGINLLNENVNESGINEDGSTWYRESGEELGDNGYRCRWTRMGGQCQDGSSEWTETTVFLVVFFAVCKPVQTICAVAPLCSCKWEDGSLSGLL
ncbi:hypothetical protein ACLOJK_002352 [Asimina triloba]